MTDRLEPFHAAAEDNRPWRLVVAVPTGLPQDWGSSGDLHRRNIRELECLSIGGAERAIVDGATHLQQEIGATSRPAHLLRFIHSPVHQEVGGPFGDRGPNHQSGVLVQIVLQCESANSQPFGFVGLHDSTLR